ncbi:type VII secretion integral membrane protein EccD [Actinokineospora auranticolor]|uniref:Type VII secretion integral membrane protein EccD n=1 Tax=Actinokineospora auranticolor TaxID=155976 RepID=A0A2S6H0F7_9PSEU|nr:type VII secretion integral membrane protein EccD [Actinokineospora auranticolor]PPK70911.1 type VII secretion integral membrane protein EccD [Actinokineospora auranticolor]
MATTATAGSGEMCRLTICGPASRVELAVPAHVPLTDLMPTVLGHLDPALATTGLAHGGWVLQRLGEQPLDEDQGTAALGLYDGDLLHLRPRDALLPLVDFDDLVDGVHTGLTARDDRWRPALGRRVLLAVMGLLAATAVLAAGLTGTMMVLSAGSLAAVLLLAAAAASRGLGDRPAALVLATAGIASAALAGLAVPAADHPFTGPGILAAAGAAAVAAAAARVAVGGSDAPFTAAALAAVLATAGAGAAVGFGLGGAAAASIALVVALCLVRVAPLVSARLAGLGVDQVPTSAAEFQQDLDPRPSAEVVDRANRADAYLTAFFVALGAVCAATLAILAVNPRWDAKTLTAVTAVLMLLHARELTAVRHRLAALLPAFAGLTTLLVAGLGDADPPLRPLLLAAVVVGVGLALAAAHLLPGRKLVPRWGRWGDLLHWATALAVIPLALSVLDVYTRLVANWL